MNTQRTLCILTLAILSMAALSSCNRNIYYSDQKDIDSDGWHMSHHERFTVEVDDTLSLFNFFVDVRNKTNYGYANTFLFINTTFPDGSIAHDTLECPLADLEGRWYGKRTGRHVDNRYYLRKYVSFPVKGTYTFDILHGMRDTTLVGISSIGLRIERVPTH